MKIYNPVLLLSTLVAGLAELQAQRKTGPTDESTLGQAYELYDIKLRKGCSLPTHFQKRRIASDNLFPDNATGSREPTWTFRGHFVPAEARAISSDVCVIGVSTVFQTHHIRKRGATESALSNSLGRASRSFRKLWPSDSKYHYPRPIVELRTRLWNLEMISHRRKLHFSSTFYERESFYERVPGAGKGVDLYIMENVNTTLEIFTGRASYFMPADQISRQSDPEHGTCITSIAARHFWGVADQMNILVSPHIMIEDQIEAIHKVIEQHDFKKQHQNQFPGWRGSIILNALGHRPSKETRRPGYVRIHLEYMEALKKAELAGVLFVTAAGNERSDASMHGQEAFPCTSPGAICVGWVNKSYTKDELSNYGMPVNIWAPGTSIQCVNGSGLPVIASGTSVAAPHVAGIIAIMLSYGQKYKRSLVDNTFDIKLTLIGNARRKLLTLPGHGESRNLLANTGIYIRTPLTPFKKIDVVKAIEKEDRSLISLDRQPRFPSSLQCYSSKHEPGGRIHWLEAQKLWLRLRWDLGHATIYNVSEGGHQTVVPCIDDACVYFKPSIPFQPEEQRPLRLIILEPEFEKAVKHILVQCLSLRKIGGYITGGYMKAHTSAHTDMYVFLRKSLSSPSKRVFWRGIYR